MSQDQQRTPRVVGEVIGGPQCPSHEEPTDTDVCYVTTGSVLPDHDDLIRLNEADPANDREWFRNHPREQIRIRPITKDEQEVLGQPASTIVCVVMSEHGPVREYRSRT